MKTPRYLDYIDHYVVEADTYDSPLDSWNIGGEYKVYSRNFSCVAEGFDRALKDSIKELLEEIPEDRFIEGLRVYRIHGIHNERTIRELVKNLYVKNS